MIGLFRQPKGFYRNVFALMVPMVLQNLITQSVALTDSFMVGMLGEEYLAAMPVALAPIFVVMIFTFGVQSGQGILVSQYWGKGNIPVINRVLGVGFYFSIIVTLSLAILLNLFPLQILSLIANDISLVEIAVQYARITSFAMVLNAISMIYLACHRSMENPRLGVIVLSISAVFSIFGNWVLIFGNLGFPALGIKGAAVSTLCARGLEVVMISVHAFRFSRLRIKLGLLLKPGIAIFRDFVRYSSPVLLNEALWGFGAMLFPVILGHMAGSQSILAAYNLSGNLERLFAVSLYACGGAAAVIVGREIGAGRQDSAERTAKTLTVFGLIFGLGSGLFLTLARLFILEPYVFPFYDLSSESSAAASIMLTIIAFSLPIRSMSFSAGIGALRGGGDVIAFALIDVGTLYLVALPIAFTCGIVLKLGIVFVYSSILADDVVKATLLLLRVRSRKWIHDVTREQIE